MVDVMLPFATSTSYLACRERARYGTRLARETEDPSNLPSKHLEQHRRHMSPTLIGSMIMTCQRLGAKMRTLRRRQFAEATRSGNRPNRGGRLSLKTKPDIVRPRSLTSRNTCPEDASALCLDKVEDASMKSHVILEHEIARHPRA